MAHQSIFGPKASIILKMVNLVSCLCHELSAKELVATAKKWGFVSQNMVVVLKLGRV